MADELITKKITEVQNFSNGDLGTIIQVQGDEIGQTNVSTLKQDITNSVVTELTETGGVSLNLVNIKGVVPTYADLALITPTPKFNDAYQVEADGLVYVYTESGFQSEGDGFIVQPEPTGVVEEGNTQAVSGGEVYNSIQNVYPVELTPQSVNWLAGNKILRYPLGIIADSGSNSAKTSEFVPLPTIFDRLHINSFLEGQTTSAVGYYSADNEASLLGLEYFNDSGETDQQKEGYLNIPEGTNYLVFCTNDLDNFSFSIATVTQSASEIDLNELKQRVDDITDSENPSNDNSLASAYDLLIQKKLAKSSEIAVKIIDGYEPKWYGIQWDEDSTSSAVTPIASDMNLHTTLPIQNKMKRCVVKDGRISYFLDDNNSLLKEDLTEAILDGSDGDVMVLIPEFYFKVIEDGSVKQIRISEEAIPGYNYSAKRLTSAFEANITNDEKLSSNVLVNFNFTEELIYTRTSSNYIQEDSSGFNRGVQKTASISSYKSNASDYKGGDGSTEFNSITDPTNTNVSKNCLGRPKSNLNRKLARKYASLKGNGALMHLYDTHKALWMLSFVELKQRNYQLPIASGGLGEGATVYPNYNAANIFYNRMRAIIPMGVTLSLGNKSGEVYYNMQNVPNSWPLGEWVDVWMPVMSYRGIENFYGHQYKSVDQINLRQFTVSGEGNNRISNLTYFYQRNPYLTNNSYANIFENIGSYTFDTYIKNIENILLTEDAHLLPINTTGSGTSYDSYYFDCCELKIPTGLNGYETASFKEISFAGRYVSNKLCGPLFICSESQEAIQTPNFARECNVTRLDYIIF